ncbi:hypothetical protein [Streptomyces osmaniensis]|uniref:Holin n=1 Tax=Streptomyces osmaniensis TaxID=593134 RepID=A0ABP6YZN8_9ACTN|nr:hypothetical protein KJK32_45460 [Streptomyces sp. JCM17656]
MTDRTKLTVLDRAHTLLVIVLGSAAAVTTMTAIPTPPTALGQLAWAALSLAAGYCMSFLTDVSVGAILARLRKRLQAAIDRTA